ncbi:hypothetical protein AAVH_27811 [Aphelenchoides avenae]|nr:hypothetical protein AAVH_27811 [Aphelenchus avenae]
MSTLLLNLFGVMLLLNDVVTRAKSTKKRYDHNCFFTPVNCRHKLPLNAVVIKHDGTIEANIRRRMRPSYGLNLRRRKPFRTLK